MLLDDLRMRAWAEELYRYLELGDCDDMNDDALFAALEAQQYRWYGEQQAWLHWNYVCEHNLIADMRERVNARLQQQQREEERAKMREWNTGTPIDARDARQIFVAYKQKRRQSKQKRSTH